MNKNDVYTSYTPTLRQKLVQRNNFNAFIHYGLNTFTDKEWGDGKVSPDLFNPTEQNTDQWVATFKEAGVDGIILTCKHHDGFCLWPTATSNYSVASSPYKNGKGDIVREVSDSCRKAGLKFGVYLSPWDRNHPDYSTERYNDTYCDQLKELLTNYGDIYCVWLDGACGSYMDGKPRQVYDFDRYYALVRELQPTASISNCGPDIRWVGNEGGFARESEWNVVPLFAYDLQTIAENSQQSDNAEFAQKGADVVFSDLGSTEFLANFNEFMWYPAEVDVSIRPGWFYHKMQDAMVRSLDNLLKIYYNSVGGNSLLLLNVPPDRRGLLHNNDVSVLKQLGAHIKQFDNDRIKIASISAPTAENNCSIDNVLDDSIDENTYDPIGYYTPLKEASQYEITLKLNQPTSINRIKIVENTAFSQRVEKFKIYATINGKSTLIYDGTTIGFGRIAVLNKAITTDTITIIFTSCRNKPYIEQISVFKDNGYRMKKVPFLKIKQFFHVLNYKIYIARENKSKK